MFHMKHAKGTIKKKNQRSPNVSEPEDFQAEDRAWSEGRYKVWAWGILEE